MTTSFEEAFKNAGIKSIDFEDRIVDESKMEAEMKIEFLEQWLAMAERNASEKEKHTLVTQHGFVSITHFSLYMAVSDDLHILEDKLSDYNLFDPESGDNIVFKHENIIYIKKEIEEKEKMINVIKKPDYYKHMMRMLGKKDISPYGENLLKF